jgi:hypothetical protein
MKSKQIFITALFAVAMLAGASSASAQFSMGGIGQRTSDVEIPFPLNPGVEIDTYILNDAEARVLRKREWNARNDVNFQVRFNGWTNQYNKSWRNGGQRHITGEIITSYKHIYSLNKYTSTFQYEGNYGMNFVDDAWFKNQDRLWLYYRVEWKLRDRGVLRNWSNSFSSDFTSQFTEGRKSRTEDELWSNFLAPGTLKLGAGFTYNSPNPKLPFVVVIDPASIQTYIVMDDRLSIERRKGLGIPVTYADDDPDELRPIFKDYKIEGGSSLNVSFDRTFALGDSGMTVRYKTTLSSFYGWMTQLGREHNGTASTMRALVPSGRWSNEFFFNPVKYLSLEFRTVSAYDRSQVDKVQMEYYLKIGFTYQYKNR